MAKRREQFTATCVRRLYEETAPTSPGVQLRSRAWTHYRVTGKGIPEQEIGPAKYHKNVIVSAVTAYDGREEVMLLAANSKGEPMRRGPYGDLVTLWGGRHGTRSAREILKEVGATKVIPCTQVARGPLDRRRRRR